MTKLITRRESTRYPGLFVKKYTKRVFYDNLWSSDSALLEARGHVEDSNGNIVIRPFTKVFNRFELNTDINRDEQVLEIQKINGFMAAATYVPLVNQVVVSTTGSLDSPFVDMAEQYITSKVKQVIETRYRLSQTPCTFLFEICHPDDPHIIPEVAGAYLIGVRDVNDESAYFSTPETETLLDTIASEMGVFRPVWKECIFSDVVSAVKSCTHEGFLVYGQTSRTALKIKSPYYLTLKLCARKKSIEQLDKSKVDEEFYGLIDYVKGLGPAFTDLNESDRLSVMSKFLSGENYGR